MTVCIYYDNLNWFDCEVSSSWFFSVFLGNQIPQNTWRNTSLILACVELLLFFKTTWINKRFFLNWTLIRLCSAMVLDRVSKTVTLQKCLATGFTVEQLFICVSAHVTVEVSNEWECFDTIFAFMGFLSRVGSLMVFKLIGENKRFFTNRAPIRPYIIMAVHYMSFE